MNQSECWNLIKYAQKLAELRTKDNDLKSVEISLMSKYQMQQFPGELLC